MIYEINRQQSESDTSSSCQECKLHQNIQQSPSNQCQNRQSSSEQEIPHLRIKNHPTKTKSRLHGTTNNSQIQSTLMYLHEEIKILKMQNQQKDHLIRQLRYEVDLGSPKHHVQIQMGRAHKDLQKIKRQVLVSPRNASNGIGRVFSPDYRQKSSAEFHQTSSKNFNTNNHQIELHIAHLEKQIRQYQIQVLQLKGKLDINEDSIEWMQKFIESFVKMAEELSFNYGQRVSIKNLPLRKKTKTCWRYIKTLINSLLKV